MKIGTFILEFNEVDFFLENAVAELLWCRDGEVGDMLVARQMFVSKLDWARKLTAHYQEKYPETVDSFATFR